MTDHVPDAGQVVRSGFTLTDSEKLRDIADGLRRSVSAYSDADWLESLADRLVSRGPATEPDAATCVDCRKESIEGGVYDTNGAYHCEKCSTEPDAPDAAGVVTDEVRQLRNDLFIARDRDQRSRAGWRYAREANEAAQRYIKILEDRVAELAALVAAVNAKS